MQFADDESRKIFHEDVRNFVDAKTAAKIIRLIEGRLDPEKVSERAARWVSECYHRPSQDEIIMAAIDDLIGGFGVESLETELEEYSYVNRGDTYAWTIMRRSNGDVFVSDWGTVVETDDPD